VRGGRYSLKKKIEYTTIPYGTKERSIRILWNTHTYNPNKIKFLYFMLNYYTASKNCPRLKWFEYDFNNHRRNDFVVTIHKFCYIMQLYLLYNIYSYTSRVYRVNINKHKIGFNVPYSSNSVSLTSICMNNSTVSGGLRNANLVNFLTWLHAST